MWLILILYFKTPSKWQHSCIIQIYAIRAFLGIESNGFVDISKSTFQKVKFDLSMDSYSPMYHFVSIFTVNIVLYPL